MSMISKGVAEISFVTLLVTIYALVIGSILAADAFTAITIINVTLLTETYGSAVVAVTAFFVVTGTIIGILFLIKYVIELFDKNTGVQAIAA